MAQRLIRTICKNCKVPTEVTDTELTTVGLSRADVEGTQFYTGSGCPECRDAGFRGRLAIFEMLEMNLAMRDMAFKQAPVHLIREEAIRNGMRGLQGDGIRKVLMGFSTIPEVLAVTAAQH